MLRFIQHTTKKLPEFIRCLVKGTLLYLTLITSVIYFTAWWIYDIPMVYHPVFVTMYTLIMTFAELPILAVRLTMEAPVSLRPDEILNDAWMVFLQWRTKHMISCAILIIATLLYVGWLLRVCLKASASQCITSRRLAYIVLSLVAFAFLILLTYALVPFLVDAYNSGWATAMLKALWRLCAWLVPNPEVPAETERPSDTSHSGTSNSHRSYPKGKASNDTCNGSTREASDGTAYSPQENEDYRKTRTWMAYFKGEKHKHGPINHMGPKQAMFETRQVDYNFEGEMDKACTKTAESLAQAMKGEDPVAMAEAVGAFRMCNTFQRYNAIAKQHKTEIAAAVRYGREAPTTTTEAWHNTLDVASQQAGKELGKAAVRGAHYAAKHGVGPMADVMFENPAAAVEPQEPPSPRDPYA